MSRADSRRWQPRNIAFDLQRERRCQHPLCLQHVQELQTDLESSQAATEELEVHSADLLQKVCTQTCLTTCKNTMSQHVCLPFGLNTLGRPCAASTAAMSCWSCKVAANTAAMPCSSHDVAASTAASPCPSYALAANMAAKPCCSYEVAASMAAMPGSSYRIAASTAATPCSSYVLAASMAAMPCCS